jgi:hypothetical protein
MSRVVFLVFALFSLAACSKNKGTTLPPPPVPTKLSGSTCPAPVASVNTQVSNTSGDASNPVVYPRERGFYVAWWDWFGTNPMISGVQVDDAGLPTSEVTYFPGEGKCVDPSIAGDGDAVYLAWLDGSTARQVTVGRNDSAPLRFGATVSSAVVGPYGAVIWEERGGLYFRGDGRPAQVDRDGKRVEPAPMPIAAGGIQSPDVVWTGEFYAVVWSSAISGGRDILLQRLTNDGRRLGPLVKVSGVSGHNNRPTIVWTGVDLVVAWTNAAPAEENPDGNYRIFLSIIARDGIRPTMTRQLEFNGSADVVSMTTTGGELAIAWVGTREPAGSAVYFRRLDLAGNLIGEQIRISDDKPVAVGKPDITFREGGYAVVWHDARDFAGSEIFFSFLACSARELSSSSDEQPSGSDDEELQLKEAF